MTLRLSFNYPEILRIHKRYISFWEVGNPASRRAACACSTPSARAPRGEEDDFEVGKMRQELEALRAQMAAHQKATAEAAKGKGDPALREEQEKMRKEMELNSQ